MRAVALTPFQRTWSVAATQMITDRYGAELRGACESLFHRLADMHVEPRLGKCYREKLEKVDHSG
jgi:hypothetical protein